MGLMGPAWRRPRPPAASATRAGRASRRRRDLRLRPVRPLNQIARITMVKRPEGMNVFEFAVLSGLRATQLSRGCSPKVPASAKVAVTAQHEVAEREIIAASRVGTSDAVE